MISATQRECIVREYDRTFGGREVVSADRGSTLHALAKRGLVSEVTMPRWQGGPWTAYLTEKGVALRASYQPEAGE